MLDYGLIGNCKTCALVSRTGSIDWFCYPSFNSPSVFAKILDDEQGGAFAVEPKGDYTIKQAYQEDTNILETTFTNAKNSFKIIDFFPRYRKILPNKKKKLFRQNNLVRLIIPTKGKPFIKVTYKPALNYAKGTTKRYVRKGQLVAKNGKRQLFLQSNVDYDYLLEETHFKLDHTKFFVIGGQKEAKGHNATSLKRLANVTKTYWKRWVGTLIIPQQHKEAIIRSALTLKLLTYSETGAIVAAPTTSLPETVGESRNWDYRFCWVRDAAHTVDALKKIGRDHEAKKLLEFFLKNSIEKQKPLQIMYGIDGETVLTEKLLDHLKGFQGSTPVRIGNAAYKQKQHDSYGSLLDIIYLYYVYYTYEEKLPRKYWQFVLYLVDAIDKRWRTKDHGIWEFRDEKHHFTHTKLMSWVGIDRAVAIAQHFGKTHEAEQWAQLRDKIAADLLKRAWHEDAHAFTMHYDSKALDAAVLLMSYHEFLPGTDPRLQSTVHAIDKTLQTDCLVKRYNAHDDFGTMKSAFTICSFWLIDALHYIGEQEQAAKRYKTMLAYANPLGLYSEDISFKTKELLGNFPQAYTHIALINSSIRLSEWQTKRKKLIIDKKRRVS